MNKIIWPLIFFAIILAIITWISSGHGGSNENQTKEISVGKNLKTPSGSSKKVFNGSSNNKINDKNEPLNTSIEEVTKIIVTDSKDIPVNGAAISFSLPTILSSAIDIDDCIALDATTITNEKGTSEIKGLPNSMALVCTVQSNNYADCLYYPLYAGGEYLIKLKNPGGVYGMVIDETGSLVTNCLIQLNHNYITIANKVLDGSYNFDGMEDGEWILLASSPDFLEYQISMTVKEGQTANQNIVLRRGLSYHGKVITKAEKEPIEGIQVRCASTIKEGVYTNEKGEFELFGLRESENIEFEGSGYWLRTTINAKFDQGRVFELGRVVSMAIIIERDDGVAADSGKVEMFGPGPFYKNGNANDNGEFEFSLDEEVSSTTVQVSYRKEHYVGVGTCNIYSADRSHKFHVKVTTPTKVKGIIVDENDLPLNGAEVSIFRASNQLFTLKKYITKATGEFVFSGLPPMDAILKVNAKDKEVSITNLSTTENINYKIVLKEKKKRTLQFTDINTAEPIIDLPVAIDDISKGIDGIAHTKSDANGNININGFTDGLYRARGKNKNYEVKDTFEINSSKNDENINISLKKELQRGIIVSMKDKDEKIVENICTVICEVEDKDLQSNPNEDLVLRRNCRAKCSSDADGEAFFSDEIIDSFQKSKKVYIVINPSWLEHNDKYETKTHLCTENELVIGSAISIRLDHVEH